MSVNQKINLPIFFAGSLFGGVLGASIALLYTPKSGKELRREINVGSKKTIEKSRHLQHEIQELSTNYSNKPVNEGPGLIDNTFSLINKVMNNINEITKMVGTVAEFTIETTNKTKEVYDDIASKVEFIVKDVVETSTEIKEEVVDQTRMISEDAKSKSKKIKKEVKDFKDESLKEINDLKETKKLEIEENEKLTSEEDLDK